MQREAAIQKLNEYVEKGRANAAAVVNQVFKQIPQDKVVRVPALRFGVMSEQAPLTITIPNSEPLVLHRNALQQAAEKMHVPVAYAEDLNSTPWGRDLLARNMNDNLVNRYPEDERFLLRSVYGETRGFLSSRFRRLDSRPVVDALLGVAQEHGAVVASGFAGEVRVSLRIVMPEVRETLPGSGDYVIVGLDFSNSDFGAGALNLSSFLLRLRCINGLMVATDFRKVHLGARLDEAVEYSDRTYRLDTAATVSAVQDTGKHLLGPARLDLMLESVRQAAGAEVDPAKALASIRKRITKAESDAIAQKFNSPDVEDLPPGHTSWRFSNAVSWLARETESGERRLELEAMAGEFVPLAAAA